MGIWYSRSADEAPKDPQEKIKRLLYNPDKRFDHNKIEDILSIPLNDVDMDTTLEDVFDKILAKRPEIPKVQIRLFADAISLGVTRAGES